VIEGVHVAEPRIVMSSWNTEIFPPNGNGGIITCWFRETSMVLIAMPVIAAIHMAPFCPGTTKRSPSDSGEPFFS